MRLLDLILVTDRTESADTLRGDLEHHGCRVAMVDRGRTPPDRLDAGQTPLVLLHVASAAAGALAWCRDLREALPGCRICALFDRAEEMDLIVALEMGADTVLVQPLDERRLIAQLRALTRTLPHRAGRHHLGELEVVEGTRDASLAGRPLDLTDAEFDLLLLLVHHQGRVLSRDAIKREIRGLPYESHDRSIDLSVVRLRRKLGDDAQRPRYIKTVRGSGYMLVHPCP